MEKINIVTKNIVAPAAHVEPYKRAVILDLLFAVVLAIENRHQQLKITRMLYSSILLIVFNFGPSNRTVRASLSGKLLHAPSHM